MTTPGTTLNTTTSQTVGPYLHIGLAPRNRSDIAFDGRTDQTGRIVVDAQVVDGDGEPLTDGMVEVWQADAEGRYDHPDDPRSLHAQGAHAVSGFGRLPTEVEGRCRFTTVKPGRVPAPDGSLQAPHLVVAFFARGLLKHLSTRIYFDDEAEANADDFVLRQVPAARRETLLARRIDPTTYRWTLVLQGDPAHETVFFDL